MCFYATTLDANVRSRCCQIECCIGEWTGGTRRDSNWDEERYKTVYFSHISSLNDLRDHGRPQGEDLLAYIQHGLFKNAR